jgi:hypothetical protein
LTANLFHLLDTRSFHLPYRIPNVTLRSTAAFYPLTNFETS